MTPADLVARLQELYPFAKDRLVHWGPLYKDALSTATQEQLAQAYHTVMAGWDKAGPPLPSHFAETINYKSSHLSGIDRTDLEQYHWCCKRGLSNGMAFYAQRLRDQGSDPSPLPEEHAPRNREADEIVDAYMRIVDAYPSRHAGWHAIQHMDAAELDRQVVARRAEQRQDGKPLQTPGANDIGAVSDQWSERI